MKIFNVNFTGRFAKKNQNWEFASPNNNEVTLENFLSRNSGFDKEPDYKSIRTPFKKRDSKPQTFIQKWNKGDICFKGKFSSGVTPKLERQVIKSIKVKSHKKQKLFEENSLDDSSSQKSPCKPQNVEDEDHLKSRKNPFLQITPQMNRKIRKRSFEANENSMDLDFSSPARTKKVSETPVPCKTYGAVPKFDVYDSPEEKNQTPFKLFEHFNDRGARFNEDFIEICNLGKGHFGSVVKWQNKLDGIEYAIKITEKQHPKKRLSMYEALQEAYALAALSVSSENPYIVRYYRGWVENEQLYIQMELCENSLYDEFSEKQLDEKAILKVLRDIWMGLNELHQRGIVHLDLKLENILLGTSGKYKLADLGLSRLIDKLKSDVPEGDSRYLAQELLSNDINAPLPDLKKCDVFSLGILVYELMEGQRMPSNGQKWHDLRENRVNFTKENLFSDQIKNMVSSMLSSDPSKRPTIDYILKRYLKTDQEKELLVYKTLCKSLLFKWMQLNKENQQLINNFN